MTIDAARLSSKGGRGVLDTTTAMINQDGDTAMTVEVVSILATRSS
jgi:transcriptional regulator GlxA family with amidase domain